MWLLRTFDGPASAAKGDQRLRAARGLKPRHGPVPCDDERPFELRKQQLCVLCSPPTESPPNPSVSGSQPLHLHGPAELENGLAQFLGEIQPRRIKVMKPGIDVIDASQPRSFGVLKRSQVLDVQLHRDK